MTGNGWQYLEEIFCVCWPTYRYITHDVGLHPHPGQGSQTQKFGFTRDHYIPWANQRWQNVRVSNSRPFSPEPSAITIQPRHFGCNSVLTMH